MAKEDAVIELEDEGLVTVEIGGDADLAAAADELAGAEVVTTKEKPGTVTVQRTSKPSAADEAAAILTQSLKTAEEGRKAAEATALSERQARETAMRTLAQRDQEAAALRETAATAELQTITTGIENSTRLVDTLTADHERLSEAGDFKGAAATLAKLARAAAALDRLEVDKQNFEAGARKTPVSTEGRVVEAAAAPFEKYVGQFAPRAQTWLRAHPECAIPAVGGDATKNATMMAAHYETQAKHIEEGSDAYFQHLEERMGYREPVSAAAEVVLAGEKPAQPQQKPAQQQRRPAPSAPPSRDSEATGAQTRSVRLTPQQQEAALFSAAIKPGETEAAFKARAFSTYARELVSAQSEGKIGRLTH